MNQALQASPRQESLPPSLKLYLLLLLILDTVDLVWQYGINGFLLHRPWPYCSPLLDQGIGGDLMVYVPLMQLRRTAAFFLFTHPRYEYPAPVSLIYGFFLAPRNPVPLYEGTILFVVVLAGTLFGIGLYRRGIRPFHAAAFVTAATLLSFPLAFELKQGNVEAWLVLLVGLGVWFFHKDQLHWAAVFFGIAAAMKIFPFVYLGLFLVRKRWTPLLTGVASAIAITLAGLFYLSPHPLAALYGIKRNISFWRYDVVLRMRLEIGFDHSAFALIKQILQVLLHGRGPTTTLLLPVSHVYMACVVLGGLILWFGRVARLPFANQVLCLVVASLVLPPNSFDYTLLHLYIAGGVLAFVAAEDVTRAMPGLRIAFVCLAIATAYESEPFHYHVFGGQIKAVALLVLLIVSARFPFPTAREASFWPLLENSP